MLVHTFIYSPKDKPAAPEAEQDDDFFDEDQEPDKQKDGHEARVQSFVGHYQPIERQINDAKIPGTYIINACVTLGCVIAYFMLDGKELVLKFYIPLDIALNMSKASFFWYTYFNDKLQKENAAKEKTSILALSGSEGQPSINDPSESLLQRTQTFKSEIQDQESKAVLDQLNTIVKLQKELAVGSDTYAMAFKAFSWRCQEKLQLNGTEVF